MRDKKSSNDFFQWKPEIPHAFYTINAWHSSLMILTGLSLYIAPLVAAYLLLHFKIHLLLKIVVIISMGFVAALGNMVLAIVTHEAAHHSLYKRRTVNQIIGIMCISVTPAAFLSCTRFFELHAHHHKYFHSINDPEEIFKPHANKLLTKKGVLLGMKNTLNYLFHYSFVSLKNLNHTTHKKGVFIFECVFYFFCLGIQIYFMWTFPPLILVYVIANFYALLLIVMVNYASHAFTNTKGINIKNETCSRWIARFFIKASFGTYLHLEHHAYPTVPAYHLPALGRFLLAQDFYNKNNIQLGTVHSHAVKPN